MSDIKDFNVEESFVNLSKSSVPENLKEVVAREKAMAIEKVASVYANRQLPYASPFLNLSDMKLPKEMRDLFKWCKYFFTFDPLVAGAVKNLSSFPITDIYFEESKSNEDKHSKEDSEELKTYRRVLTKKIKIHKLLVEIGLDYFLYGNCFIFGEFEENEITKEMEWKHVIRLDPSKIIIDKNQITQEITYKWEVPDSVIQIVNTKKPEKDYEALPEKIKEAVKKNKAIVLNKDNIYHFATPSDSLGKSEWGTPIVANVLKLLMYRNTLRQAQEAIAKEHIVPFRVYYFQPTDKYDPSTDWTKVSANFSKELQKSTRDPNYKVVSPVPVNVLNLGGQGRALLLTGEIEQIQAEILAGMGVPREFIFGGVSWSGSSTSLKILENLFITYRLFIKDFINNFLIKNMAKKRGEWRDERDDDILISAHLVDLKMQDDVQQKQLIINLNGAGKVTDETMWKAMGLDPEKQKSALETETLEKVELESKIQIARIKANIEIQKAQIEAQMELQKLQQKMGINVEGEEGMGGEDMGEEVQDSQQRQPQEEVHESSGGNEQQGEQQSVKQLVSQLAEMPEKERNEAIQQFPPKVQKLILSNLEALVNAKEKGTSGRGYNDAQKIAMQLAEMPEQERNESIKQLPDEIRDKVLEILEYLVRDEEDSQKSEGEGEGADMRPLPQQKPPRRK